MPHCWHHRRSHESLPPGVVLTRPPPPSASERRPTPRFAGFSTLVSPVFPFGIALFGVGLAPRSDGIVRMFHASLVVPNVTATPIFESPHMWRDAFRCHSVDVSQGRLGRCRGVDGLLDVFVGIDNPVRSVSGLKFWNPNAIHVPSWWMFCALQTPMRTRVCVFPCLKSLGHYVVTPEWSYSNGIYNPIFVRSVI